MKMILENSENLFKFSKIVGGVFTLAELSSLFNISETQKLRASILKFEDSGLLSRYCRGVYIAKDFNPSILSAKIRSNSYISFGSALAEHKLIGTESPFLISCVVPAKAAEFSGKVNISFSRISQDLYFGFTPNSLGVKLADPEKAVLDTFYFYQHGMIFHFNIFQDILFSSLSKEKLEAYLVKFNNPKFQAFVRNSIYGKI